MGKMPPTRSIAARVLALAVAPFILSSCSQPEKADPPRWRVTSHVGSEWTFSRRAVNGDPARRIVAVCAPKNSPGHGWMTEDACSLVK